MKSSGLLLAEQYFFHLRNPFRNSTWQDAVVFGGVALAAVLSLWLISRWLEKPRARVNSPWRLFRELCAAHHLSYYDRSLLVRLAKHHQLSSPAALFLEPGLWDGDKLGTAWQAQAAQRRSLRERLFARGQGADAAAF